MSSSLNEIKLYNRENEKLETEMIFEKKIMDFFYGHSAGEVISRKILSKKIFSSLYGIYQDTFLSKKSIQKFVEKYPFNTDEMELPLEAYKNFNQFFTRKLKADARKIDKTPSHFISPADSKVIVYPIQKNTILPIKGLSYSLEDLLKSQTLAQKYDDGICMIFRLAPMDYHRFCYIDDGTHGQIIDIPGLYYSVHPFALLKNHPVFTENHRQYTVLDTNNFGQILYMEVGAMFVGTIYQHHPFGSQFEKGDEKGYFKFGGSTIVVLSEKGKLAIDADILHHSSQGIETIVKYGEKIAKKGTLSVPAHS